MTRARAIRNHAFEHRLCEGDLATRASLDDLLSIAGDVGRAEFETCLSRPEEVCRAVASGSAAALPEAA